MAIRHHEQARAGYGTVFADEYQAAVERLQADPGSFAKVTEDYRSISLRKLPYSLVFRCVSKTGVVIVAVAHAKRRQGYWQKRLRP